MSLNYYEGRAESTDETRDYALAMVRNRIEQSKYAAITAVCAALCRSEDLGDIMGGLRELMLPGTGEMLENREQELRDGMDQLAKLNFEVVAPNAGH